MKTINAMLKKKKNKTKKLNLSVTKDLKQSKLRFFFFYKLF